MITHNTVIARMAHAVMKGHFLDAAAIEVNLHENFFEHVKIARAQIQLVNQFVIVQAKAARKIAQLEAEQDCVSAIENGAENSAADGHVCLAAGNVTRGNQQIRRLSFAPEIFEKDGRMRKVGIHGRDIWCASRRISCQQGSAITAFALLDQPRAQGSAHCFRIVVRAGVDHHNFQ